MNVYKYCAGEKQKFPIFVLIFSGGKICLIATTVKNAKAVSAFRFEFSRDLHLFLSREQLKFIKLKQYVLFIYF